MKVGTKEQVIKRLKITQGHLRKVIQMVEKDAYCPNVIQQSTAVQSALRKVDELLLDGHLHTCVTNAIKSGGGEKEIQELLKAFRQR